MNPNTLQTICQWVVALGVVMTAFGGLGSFYYAKKVEKIKVQEAHQELAKAGTERAELKSLLEPFVNYAKQRFPEQDTKEALEKLAGELKDLQQDVSELTPFKLDRDFKNVLTAKLGELIHFEKNHGLDKVKIEFVLFPEQSPEASELVRFMRSVFKSNKRDTRIAMVHNSGIPTNLRGIIFTVKHSQNPPTLLEEFNSVMKSLKFQI